jgi:hypothetical protein
MGLDQHERFHLYHRVLSRARWSSREASRILLGLLLEAFVGQGPFILGIDETLERRYGKKIAARGVYRDPVHSTHEEFVKSRVL